MRGREPRIAVLGAGANGGGIGVDLVGAGLDVTFVEQWPEHVDAIRRDGLRVELPDRTTVERIPALHLCEVAERRDAFDLVLMLVKAYDAGWAARLLEPLLAEDGLLIAVQNGMTADLVAEVVGEDRTLGCVIEVSGELVAPGFVRRHTPADRSWFALGALGDDGHPALDGAAEVLEHAGSVSVVDDIRSAKWMKLVSNCTTLVSTAALGLPMIAALETPGMRDLMVRAGQEALEVGRGEGHAVLPIFGLAPADLARPDTVVETLLDTLYRGFVLPTTTTTVLHDWRRGRRSEAEQLNGHVVRLGARHGIPTPANDALMAVARGIERGDLRPEPRNAERLLALAG
ncbi:ketopantoate reductase family protein [Agromyces binzhouensis]|uniref:2-dehydropantoate 2-reductase n=1 Tax=Agromyces binzhouensis TaxID=1817495 RepID=A0A4Q2JYJ9_9MICO|nr:2-dehydropantoate 2-reductase [Agromyces binzhouensis]RXZ51690.1 2-dehydropantoate 2-reductase [Agromyces binzhouensis]